jgi:N6-adenosine-specific RNA methylase IME4
MKSLYSTIYADPPWLEIGGGKICRGAQRHYSLMSTKEICQLRCDFPGESLPLSPKELAGENAHLYLWVTNNKLPDGLEVVKAWGFEYKTMITWAKDRFGLGQYFRGQTEHCIFAVRGVLPYRVRPDGKRAQGRTLIQAPRGEHSRKPESLRQVIEIVSHPPYLELFARFRAPNWDVWGNQAPEEIGPVQSSLLEVLEAN